MRDKAGSVVGVIGINRDISKRKRAEIALRESEETFRAVFDQAAVGITVVSLAHSLGLLAIAVGVETEAQLAFLAEHGCDQAQGYYFARPMPAAEFGKCLAGDRRRP